ncbi:MAG: sensor histidine kinase [Caldilinea sp.]
MPKLPADINVEIEVEPGIPMVRADVSQVSDILRNLYTNAVEAVLDGGTITLRARHVGRHIEFQVQDTGPGILRDSQKKIFNLFYSTKGSTGFGLWSARRNALANGGDLMVKSEPGKGAMFVLRLLSADAPVGGQSR